MLKLSRQIKSKIRTVLAVKLNFSQCAETKIVELPVGKVKGRHNPGITGHDFYSFEGLPYGKAPVGEMRFLPAQPADPWKELDCLQEREVSVQWNRDKNKIFGSEDCLYLNIYTKHFDTTKEPLPVILYFHGGSFNSNGATRHLYGPDYLMREEIVFVVFNYRLCSLGFLMLDSPELGVHGNAGIHDQLMALRWVNNYISHFNGNPKNITIMGTSAGASSVHFMMCLPQACGLFQRVIMISGAMICPWCQVPNLSSFPSRLAISKGYKGEIEDEHILKFLRSLPPEELVRHDLVGPKDLIMGHPYAFVPGLEAKLEGDFKDRGLIQRPFLDMMRDAWSKEIPLLLGGTSFEGLVMYPACKFNNWYLIEVLQNEPALLLPYELYRCLPCQERTEKTQNLINFHFGPRTITKADVHQILDLFSYKLFWHGIHRLVISRLAFAQASTYLLCFDFDSPTANLMRIAACGTDITTGVCHADELAYIFPRFKGPLGEAEKCTIERMVGILTAFARNGNPNCIETKGNNWPAVSEKDPYVAMNIGRKLEVQTLLEKDGIKVWNQLYNNDKALLYGI